MSGSELKSYDSSYRFEFNLDQYEVLSADLDSSVIRHTEAPASAPHPYLA